MLFRSDEEYFPAIRIGSVQYGRACPSLNDGLARNPYGWEAFLIRRFKIQSANRNEIKRRAGSCDPFRSEERRVGQEGVSTRRSRWSPYHSKKKKTNENYNMNTH